MFCCVVAHCLATLIVTPCCTCYCALLFSITPCYSCFVAFILVPYCFRYFVAHALLLALPCFHYLTPFVALLLTLVALPLCLAGWWALLPYHIALLLTITTCLFQVPHGLPPIVVLLPYCSALSLGTPSRLSCAGGGTCINTNKLHPTTKVFFQKTSWVFFFLI
jgi:hypothetical protein